ncbi:little elongation complex subunit 2 isoform X1 [Neodiprion pinetum]|uniref:little elongation complex subunit 2 isoform X1 n=1 Tax=Neodiprion pinetum TaxID=441929 RepID=UPI001EDE47D1|nr:uncharacterized protein LOC124214857 isoform X1 [Neodiprion pinetum]
MEEFLNIDWYPPLEDMIDDVFIHEERLKNESAMYRIMQGVFTDPFTDFESDDDDDRDKDDGSSSDNDSDGVRVAGKESKRPPLTVKKWEWVPGLEKPPFQFPRLSVLTKEEHAICLKVLKQFSGSEKPQMNQQNRSELEQYMKLLPVIRKEQEEFLALAKANWNGSEIKVIGKEYINARWKSKFLNARKLPRYYVAGGNIAFKEKKKIVAELEATLLEKGQLPRAFIPVCNKRNYLSTELHKLYALYPVFTNLDNSNETSQKLTVSQDPNCEKLATSNGVDVVISSGGLNCLATNFGPHYTSSWILPIVVKGSEEGNIIYIDKPLPPTSMTIPQRNSWIYKYILRSQILHPKHHTSVNFSKQGTEEEVTDHSLFGDIYSDDLLKLEDENSDIYSAGPKSDMFQTSENTAMENKAVIKNEQAMGGPSSHEMEDEFDLFTSKELSQQYTSGDFCVEEKDHSAISIAQSMKLDSINDNDDKENEMNVESVQHDAPDTETHTQNWTKTNISATASPPVGNNVTYKIFSLCPPENCDIDSSKTMVEKYKILVRAKIDGVERMNKNLLHPIMLVPKLEHQVSLGAEAVTAEEALKQWTMLTYRPNTSLVRVRISAKSSDIIQVERRTIGSINNEMKRLYGLNGEDSLVILHNVVHELKKLKPGNYLLRHTPSNGAFATIYQEAEFSAKNVFDLHSVYSQNYAQIIPKPSWPPIDTMVVTPAFAFSERMPATYYPSKHVSISASNYPRGRGKGRARGRGRGGLPGRGRTLQSAAIERSTGINHVDTKRGKQKKFNVQHETPVEQS